MNDVIPNEDVLDPLVTDALRFVLASLTEDLAVSHAPDGRAKLSALLATQQGVQSIPDSTWTPITFNNETDLRSVLNAATPLGVHSKTTGTNQIVVPGRGIDRVVRVVATVSFAAAANGSRGARVTVNTALQSGAQVFYPVAVSGEWYLQVVWMGVVSGGDTIAVEAYQSSGGPLNSGSNTAGQGNAVCVEFL